MTIRDSRDTSYELTAEQKRSARRLILLMDQGLTLPDFDNRPDVGALTPSIDQLCEAYLDAGISGFRKAIKALSVDQRIIAELHTAIRKNRYRSLSITDLLNMPEQEWILTNYLYEDAISFVYGPPGCGKSFLALDWACHLALGIPWLGRLTKRCRVVYVATEGVLGYRRRIQAWCHRHGYSPADLLDTMTFVPCAVQLGNTEEVDDFIDMQLVTLESHHDGLPTILILDTIFQCAAGMNINQTDVATLLVSTVQRIKQELHTTHIVLVHHSGKDKERGMSGNMALKASTDLSYQVEKDRDGEIKVTADKVKDDENTVTYLKLEKVIYGVGERDHSCVVIAGEKPEQAEQLQLIERHMLEVLPTEDGLSFTDWLKAVHAALDTMKSATSLKSTFNRHKEVLLNKGLIRRIGTDTKPLYVRIPQESEENDDAE